VNVLDRIVKNQMYPRVILTEKKNCLVKLLFIYKKANKSNKELTTDGKYNYFI